MSISWSLGDWIPVLRHVPAGQGPSVALTIDDAPNPDTTPQILDLLDLHQAKASFFLSGCRAHSQLDLVEDIVRRGHWVYAHGWDHIRLDKAGPSRMREDMERCEALLSSFRPTPYPYLVRLPQNGGYRNALIHRALRNWQPGCQFAHWGTSTEDHLIAPRCDDANAVEQECRREVDRLLADHRLSGSILLMHDQPINERPNGHLKGLVTVTLVRLLLDGLTSAGYHFSPIVPRATQAWWSRFMLT